MPTAAPHASNEEYTMPRTEALLAGTMALMTGHAQSCRGADREAMAQKIGANLSVLSEDPMLSPGFQALLWALRNRWNDAQSRATASYGNTEALWHRSPKAVQ